MMAGIPGAASVTFGEGVSHFFTINAAALGPVYDPALIIDLQASTRP
jgi:hypothetical protein